MVRVTKKKLHGVPQYSLPPKAHLVEVRRAKYSGHKGVRLLLRYHRGPSPASVAWVEWGEDNPSFAKRQWLLVHGDVGPGRYGDPIVLYISYIEYWQSEPILEYL